MNYAEYLKSQGATEEEVKILDTSVARKAFEKMQAESSEAKALADKATREKLDYEAQVDKWHTEKIVPEYERMKNEALAAKANEAKARAVIEAAQKEGLLDVAATMGWDKKDDKKVDNKFPEGFDPNEYFKRSEVLSLAEKEAEAIAIAQDIAYEHRILFPDKPMRFRELLTEARTKKVPVEQVWKEKFGVDAARQARDKADQDARDKKIRDEAYAAAQSELASKYGNPDVRPLATSRSPLTPRPDSGRDKQPWDIGDKSGDRVQRATSSVIKQFSERTN